MRLQRPPPSALFALLSFFVGGCAATLEPAPNGPPETNAAAASPVPEQASERAGPRTYDGEQTKTIAAKSGERFVVALSGNITTPFKWSLEPAPSGATLRAVSDAYADAPPKGCEGCVGYRGTRAFTLEAVAAGSETLHFVYRGLGDASAPPKRKAVIQVTVD